MAIDPKDKTKPHDIVKMTIKYRSKLDGERYIAPGAEQATFEHLSDADYILMRRKNLIRPVAEVAAKPAAKKEG
jgi:hypothetical protein